MFGVVVGRLKLELGRELYSNEIFFFVEFSNNDILGLLGFFLLYVWFYLSMLVN